MIHLLWIAVVTLITFSVILAKPQWATTIAKHRARTNDKYKLPPEFWRDINELEVMLHEMNQDNARYVFNAINKVSDKYMRFYMNFTYDQQMNRLITKYNDKVFLLSTKTK